jgi:hypothetical protein
VVAAVVAPEFATEGPGGVPADGAAEVVDQILLLAHAAVTNSPHNLSQLRKETVTATLASPPQ